MLAPKGSQGTLHDDMYLYFSNPELLLKCAYTKTIEKNRSSIEKREHWQTDDISWLTQKKDWTGLKSIAMTKTTITKNGKMAVEVRFFISSLPVDIEETAWAPAGIGWLWLSDSLASKTFFFNSFLGM